MGTAKPALPSLRVTDIDLGQSLACPVRVAAPEEQHSRRVVALVAG
ncbi:hypothetical protein [Leptolyngbya sp. PCC 6406]|nr:hypothetical protein [Leptolyngbya sp. PCC 6406]